MNNMNKNVEESKQAYHQEEQTGPNINQNPEELIAEVVQILNGLFDPKSLINNGYLVRCAKGVTFEIPVQYIYDEYSIRAKTPNRELIDQALLQTENVTVVMRDDKVEAVKPKHDQTKSKVTISGVDQADYAELEKHVNSFLTHPDDIISSNFNNQLHIVILNCKDEDIAANLYNKLTTNPFKGSSLHCSLEFLTLYISALENTKKRKKAKSYQQPRPNPNPYYMNPYQQMQAYYMNMNAYQMGYMRNVYPGPNFYPQQNMGSQMNMQGNMMNMGPSEGNYNNYAGRKNFNSNRRGGYNKFNNKTRYNKGGSHPSNVHVNDNDFPPLNNQESNNPE